MRRNVSSLVVFLMIFCGSLFDNVYAHESQPGLLQLIQQQDTRRYEVLWRIPIYYGKPHPASLQLPAGWKTLGPATIRQLADSALHRRVVLVDAQTIHGSKIRFPGLDTTTTDVLVRVEFANGTKSTALIKPTQPWLIIEGPRPVLQVAWDYTRLGVEHILSGIDHLLFVLALLLIVTGMSRLLITITSFTLAHSITLAAATLGWLWVPGPPVEAVIALSILFLASELVKVSHGEQSLTASYPWVVAFTFGLLHGFGFAGALSEVGLPHNEIPLALLMFNVGVELGQVLFVIVMLILIFLLKKVRMQWSAWSRQIPAYAIGTMAAFWFFQRVSGF